MSCRSSSFVVGADGHMMCVTCDASTFCCDENDTSQLTIGGSSTGHVRLLMTRADRNQPIVARTRTRCLREDWRFFQGRRWYSVFWGVVGRFAGDYLSAEDIAKHLHQCKDRRDDITIQE